MSSSDYWENREARVKKLITDKSIKEVETQLTDYYARALRDTMVSFVDTYEKVMKAGDKPTPADLYNLDKYWEMMKQLETELTNLGRKEIALLGEKFELQWKAIYDELAYPTDKMFAVVSKAGARQMINQVWCADGLSWSERVWNNIDLLRDTLNQNLITCVTTGKRTRQLKQILMDTFSVSYKRAETLVRTEMAHIETQAAAQRYKDSGIEYYKFLASTDHRTCDECAALDGKKFRVDAMEIGVNAPPMHPNCRDTIIPVQNTPSAQQK